MADESLVSNPGTVTPADELGEYRSVSGLALAALVFALVSPLAWLHVLLWPLAWAAIGLGVWALARIARTPELSGRGLAVAAVALAVVSAVGPPVRDMTYRAMLQFEARRVAGDWFKHLADNQPQLAHQLTREPWMQLRPEADAWAWYREHPQAAAELSEYVNKPIVRSLLGLGEKARARFYEHIISQTVDNDDMVLDTWVVTYDNPAGERESFFVAVTLIRQYDPSTRRGLWKVRDVFMRTKGEGDAEPAEAS